MKNLFFLAFLLFGFNTNAQNLNLDQLLLLTSKDQDYVESYLMTRGWEEAPSSSGTDITWAYGRRQDLMSSDILNPQYNAISWFHLQRSDGHPAVIYDIISAAKYQAIKQRAAALGFKRISSTQDNQGSAILYRNNSYKLYLGTKYKNQFRSNLISGENDYQIMIVKIK